MNLNTQEKMALGFFIVVLFIAIKKGVFTRDKGQKLDVTTTVTDNSTPTLSDAQYKNKAISIHNSLSSSFQGFTGELENIVDDLTGLKDADLISTANAYAALYPTDDYKTLYSIIQGTTANYFNDVYTKKYALLERMKKLGL